MRPHIPNICSFLLVWTTVNVSGQFLRGTSIQDESNNSTDYPGSAQGIIGGERAVEGEFPWFVAFEPMVQCGGTLIAPNRVLTAAHCVYAGAPTQVRIGSTTLVNGEKIGAQCGSYHPEFYIGEEGDLYNDIAILKLKENSGAPTIGLNADIGYPSASGTPLTVIGYGATNEGGSTSTVLKKLGTYFQTIDTCKANYDKVEYGTHVCGNVDDAGDCQGDSGGPLFDTSQKQVGVVSYGYGCARSSEDVYAGIAKHYDWIQQQINNDDCNVETTGHCLLDLIYGVYNRVRATLGFFSEKCSNNFGFN